MGNAFPVVAGDRFWRLTVLGPADPHITPSGYRIRQVAVRCDCGAETVVHLGNLRSGNSTNCGCLRNERSRQRRTTHGMSTEPIYACWCNMKQRSSGHYIRGYRGVGRDARWDRFETFLADMGPTYFAGAVLARFGDTGDYTPMNCRWLTAAENNAEAARVRRQRKAGRP